MDREISEPAVIAVFGLGYVGCATAAGLASLGHRVIGVDREPKKIRSVQAGEPLFYEPGLRALLKGALDSGRLTATADAAEALQAADVAMICVGTPGAPDGGLDPTQIQEVSATIAGAIKGSQRPLIVTVRSTVLPGMCDSMIQPHFESGGNVSLVSNPEFLRESQAVNDFLHPTRIVVGGENAVSVRFVANLYKSLGVAPVLTGLREAETIKYACNALNAMKIDFANEIGAYCARLGIAADQVMETVCRERLGASAYMKPGFAFGGSCLGKDVRALSADARKRGIKLPLLEAIMPSNEQHLSRVMQELGGSSARLGMFGLAFKPGTDDLRESAAVRLVEQLVLAGREVRIFDVFVSMNPERIQESEPWMGRLLFQTVGELIEWSEELLLIHRPDDEALEKIAASGIPVRNVYSGNFKRAESLVRSPAQVG